MKNLLGVLFFAIYCLSTSSFAMSNEWGMEFVEVSAGSFEMGLKDAWDVIGEMDEPDENKFNDEMPVHTIEITNAFLLGKTEVTQAQWLAIMKTKPGPEENWNAKSWQQLPVTGISWNKASDFIETISGLDKKFNYRLPTEAEWEYAARAGTTDVRPVPLEELNDVAWFIKSSDDHVHPVATLKPNGWGLYDMLGNLWEWTNDWYSPKTFQQGNRVDPLGPEKGRSKVRRGGSFHCPIWQVRPGYRSANKTDVAYSVLGLRVVAIRLN